MSSVWAGRLSFPADPVNAPGLRKETEMQGFLIKLIFGADEPRRDKPPDVAGWRWQLIDADGLIRAESPARFRRQEQCLRDCRDVLFEVWSVRHILFPVEVLIDAFPERIAA